MDRIAALRAELTRLGLDGLLIPRADKHQGEYVAACDERLAWATGFTGSAGAAVVLLERAAIVVDGRYELQAADQVDGAVFEVVPSKDTPLVKWLGDAVQGEMRIGFDPWLHPPATVERLRATVEARGAALVALERNPIDTLWEGRPPAPTTPARAHPEALAGIAAAAKRAEIGEALGGENLDAAVLTAPDGIAWLLNVRGGDVAHLPVVQAFAIIEATGQVAVFTDPAKFDDALRAALGDAVSIQPEAAFLGALAALTDRRVAVEKTSAPEAVAAALRDAGAEVVWRADPTLRPKARKTAAEIAGARSAHLRDGAAMAATLAWIDRVAPAGGLDELTVSAKLTEMRAETAARLGSTLEDESFASIVGFGPNGAIVHYRVDAASNRPIAGDGLLLLDSGGQYQDGTTDVTRTIAIGTPPAEAVAAATRVLKGMIAVSQARFPAQTKGRELDALARAPLWTVGLDYDHGTGHGVGSFLSVHEGPAGLSKRASAALEAGMILSNEPGYYRAGAFGIRIENLVLVGPAEIPLEADAPDARRMHGFETLTLVPIDRRLIDAALLSADERRWLDAYHARVASEIRPLTPPDVREWLDAACAPLV